MFGLLDVLYFIYVLHAYDHILKMVMPFCLCLCVHGSPLNTSPPFYLSRQNLATLKASINDLREVPPPPLSTHTERITKVWNELPDSVVTAPNVKTGWTDTGGKKTSYTTTKHPYQDTARLRTGLSDLNTLI